MKVIEQLYFHFMVTKKLSLDDARKLARDGFIPCCHSCRSPVCRPARETHVAPDTGKEFYVDYLQCRCEKTQSFMEFDGEVRTYRNDENTCVFCKRRLVNGVCENQWCVEF